MLRWAGRLYAATRTRSLISARATSTTTASAPRPTQCDLDDWYKECVALLPDHARALRHARDELQQYIGPDKPEALGRLKVKRRLVHPSVIAHRANALATLLPDVDTRALLRSDPKLWEVDADRYREALTHLTELVRETQCPDVPRAVKRIVAAYPTVLCLRPSSLLRRIERLENVLPNVPVLELLVRAPSMLKVSRAYSMRVLDVLRRELALNDRAIAEVIGKQTMLLAASATRVLANIQHLRELLPDNDVAALVVKCPQLLNHAQQTLRDKVRTLEQGLVRLGHDASTVGQLVDKCYVVLIKRRQSMHDRLCFLATRPPKRPVQDGGPFPLKTITSALAMPEHAFATCYPRYMTWQNPIPLDGS